MKYSINSLKRIFNTLIFIFLIFTSKRDMGPYLSSHCIFLKEHILHPLGYIRRYWPKVAQINQIFGLLTCWKPGRQADPLMFFMIIRIIW